MSNNWITLVARSILEKSMASACRCYKGMYGHGEILHGNDTENGNESVKL